MWIFLNDCFLSIVHKDCARDEVLVRARRKGDIEKVFGKDRFKVSRVTQADYLYRAVIPREVVAEAMTNELARVTYSNFKSSVIDEPLHEAYLNVWNAMAGLQSPAPYSGRFNFAQAAPKSQQPKRKVR